MKGGGGGGAGGSKNVKVISDQFSSLFGTSFIFLLKCSFSQIGGGQKSEN